MVLVIISLTTTCKCLSSIALGWRHSVYDPRDIPVSIVLDVNSSPANLRKPFFTVKKQGQGRRKEREEFYSDVRMNTIFHSTLCSKTSQWNTVLLKIWWPYGWIRNSVPHTTRSLFASFTATESNPDLIFTQYFLASFATKVAERHHLFSFRLFASFHLFACKDSNLSTRLPFQGNLQVPPCFNRTVFNNAATTSYY